MRASSTTPIGVPDSVLDQVDLYVRLTGAFRSRQELIAYAILHFLECRLEEPSMAS